MLMQIAAAVEVTDAPVPPALRGSDSGRMQWTNGVTNRAEADRILRRWAEQLRKGLDATVRQ